MKKFILGVTAILFSATMFAAPRTAEEAAAIAAQFTNAQPQLARMHKAPRTQESMRLAYTGLKPASTEAAYYVFNQENNAGCVFVSAEDRTLDVLGYTDDGQFNPATVNPNLKFWLERYAEEIANVNDENAYDVSAARKAAQGQAIAPLLKNKDGKNIAWYQEAPYYNLCPKDQRDNTRCLTGCVATAASQIMYKWRYPEKGTGSHSYTWYDCMDDYCESYKTKELSVDFASTTYDWDNMLPAYEGKSYTAAQAEAVATLMYHAGVACDMMYGGDATGGSGAWTDDMGYGLKTYFGYNVGKFLTTYSKTKYKQAKGTAIADVPCEFSQSINAITTAFNTDLEAGRPILMGGESSKSGGHEFVCDGRDTNGKFHINWGWEGQANGYFALSALNPKSGGESMSFSSQIDALIGIEPAQAQAIETTAVTEKAGYKYFENGQLIIIREGVKFNALGQQIQ